MADTAAHLVDDVLPRVPVRQWVLSFPHRIRWLLAYDPRLCAAVRRIFVRVVLDWLEGSARREGLVGARSGAVVFTQRFGGAPFFISLLRQSFGAIGPEVRETARSTVSCML